jgi:SAM-dependent methyltransferase
MGGEHRCADNRMSGVSTSYDIDDPVKIQGRDDIVIGSRNIAEIRLERALDAIGEVEGRLLLLGAGAGRYARALANARPDLDIIAGDLSSVAIREALQYGGRPLYLVFDAQRIPFASESIGAVVFFDLLEHVPEPLTMLEECARVLAPGGVLHFFVPLEDQPRTLYHALRDDSPVPIHRWKLDHVGHIQRYSATDVIALVWRAGLRPTHTSYSFHLSGQVHDIVDYWQRERVAGGSGRVPVGVVRAVSRGVFLFTWRLAYLEDRVFSGSFLASALHLTANKPPEVCG